MRLPAKNKTDRKKAKPIFFTDSLMLKRNTVCAFGQRILTSLHSVERLIKKRYDLQVVRYIFTVKAAVLYVVKIAMEISHSLAV